MKNNIKILEQNITKIEHLFSETPEGEIKTQDIVDIVVKKLEIIQYIAHIVELRLHNLKNNVFF